MPSFILYPSATLTFKLFSNFCCNPADSNVYISRKKLIFMLIAIDYGNNNIKTKHRAFTAGLLWEIMDMVETETVRFVADLLIRLCQNAICRCPSFKGYNH